MYVFIFAIDLTLQNVAFGEKSMQILINFNSMSTHLGLLYALKLGNLVHCTFIFTFFV